MNKIYLKLIKLSQILNLTSSYIGDATEKILRKKTKKILCREPKVSSWQTNTLPRANPELSAKETPGDGSYPCRFLY